MTIESPVNPYGVPEKLPTLLSSLMTVDAPFEQISEDIVALCRVDHGQSSSQKVIPYLYDQGELKDRCTVALTYTLKRLMRGLASLAAHTKLNYATTLASVIKSHQKDLPPSLLLEWIRKSLSKDAVSGDSRMNTTEENAMIAGKLLAFHVLASTIPISAIAEQILVDVMGIWKAKDSLCCLAQAVIIKVLSGSNTLDRKSLLKIVETLFSDDCSSLKAIALVIAVRSECSSSSFGRKIKDLDVDFSNPVEFMPLISLIDTIHLDRPVYFIFLQSLLVASSKSSSNEFFGAFNVLQNFPPIITRAIKVSLQNDSTDAVLGLLFDLDPKILNEVLSSVCGLELTLLERVRLADLHLHLLKPGSPLIASTHAIESVLVSLMGMKLSFEDSSDKISMRIQSALIRALCAAETRQDIDRDQVLMSCLKPIDEHFNVSSKEGKKNFKALDDPVKDAWSVALDLISRLQKRLEKSTATKYTHCYFQVLLCMSLTGRLLLVLDPISSASIFEDLHECFNKLRKGDFENSEEDHPVDVLVDILVQWQSRSSALLRKIADDMFSKLVPYLTENAHASISRILLATPGNEGELLDEDEVEEDSDTGASEDDCENDIDETASKRPRLDSVSLSSEAETETETEAMDLDTADPEELEILDKQLSAIMTARKDHQSAKMTNHQNLIHFKQRLCDWLQIIEQKTPKEKLFIVKLKLIPTFLKMFKIHSSPKDFAANPKYSGDRELMAKVSSLFNLFYSKPPLDKVEMSDEAISETAESLVKILSENLHESAADLRRYFTAFWFVFCGDNISSTDLVKALHPIWVNFVKGADKAHNTNFLSFFEQLRAKSPLTLILLVSRDENLSLLCASRLYTREKIIRFIEPAIKKGSDDERVKSAGCAFFRAMAAIYLSGMASEGFLAKESVAHFRDELVILNSLISRSRNFLGSEALSTWSPLIEKLQAHIASFEDRLPASQIDALKGRIKNVLALL